MTLKQLEWCKICGKPMFESDGPHTCPPLFHVMCDEYDQGNEQFYHAKTHEDAIKKWAHWYECKEGPKIVSGMGDLRVKVRARRFDEKDWKEFFVSGEWVPEYFVLEVA